MRKNRHISSSWLRSWLGAWLASWLGLGWMVALTVAAPAAAQQVGDVAADFTLLDVHDNSWTLSAQRGKVVLLEFMGFNCQPCIESGPGVEAIWQDFRTTGNFQVLAVDLWNGAVPSVQSYIEQAGVTFPVLRDASSLLLDGNYSDMDVDHYLVIDPDGVIRYTSLDEPFTRFNDTALRAAIQKHMPTPAATDTWGTVKGLYR